LHGLEKQVMSFSHGIVAWSSFSVVIPRLDRGIQSFFVFLWIPWSSHGMTLIVFFDPYNNATPTTINENWDIE
jgi:hypothetical protein